MIKVRVPATSANLGPGFDCIGLALDLWNEVSFEPCEKVTFRVTGEGADKLDKQPNNLLTKAYMHVYEVCGQNAEGVGIRSHNQVPHSSGMGSSAAAIVAGVCGANEMLGRPLAQTDLLKIATELEGHPDNVAPALLGGLVVSVMNAGEIISRRYDVPAITTVIVKPEVDWPTRVARAVLPVSVPRADAIFNIGRTTLVVDALRNGDLDLLRQVMDDRLHQPYRLERIPAGRKAYLAAREFGAAALSGAGPSILCFVEAGQAAGAMASIQAVFEAEGIASRGFVTQPSNAGYGLLPG
ncbi:MAG: homoserine kinase [Chloroflexi bacterium]|nr:homoserine kinase [Chloroflexota bacterium]